MFPAQHGSLQVTTGRDYDTQQIPFRMWVFPGWKGAWINPEVCCPFPLTPEQMLWGSESVWKAQSGRFTLIPRAPWSLSRKDKSTRKIFLCKQLAQRGNSPPGRKLGNGGLQEGVVWIQLPSSTHPSWKNRDILFWGCKTNGADMPPWIRKSLLGSSWQKNFQGAEWCLL